MNSVVYRITWTLGLLYFVSVPYAGAAAPQKHLIMTHAEIGSQPPPAKKSKELIAAEDKLLSAEAKLQMAKVKGELLNVDFNAVKEKAEQAQVILAAAKKKTKLANEKAYAEAEAALGDSLAKSNEEENVLKARLDKLSSRQSYNHVAKAADEINAGYALLTRQNQAANDRYHELRWSSRPYTPEQKEASKEEAIAKTAADNLALQLVAAKGRYVAGAVNQLTSATERLIASDELKGQHNEMTAFEAKRSAATVVLISEFAAKLSAQTRDISEHVDKLLTSAKRLTVIENDLAKHQNRPVEHCSYIRIVGSGKSKAEVAAALVDLTSNLKDCVSAIDKLASTVIPVREGDTDRAEAILQKATSMSVLGSAKTELEIAASALSTTLTKWNAYEIE